MDRALLCIVPLLSWAATAVAQPCGSSPQPAILLTGSNPGDTTGAPSGCGTSCTWAPPLASCPSYGMNNSPEVWYVFSPPPGCGGALTLTTCTGVSPLAFAFFDTSLAAFEGACPGPFAFADCNGAGPLFSCPNSTSLLTIPVAPGKTYWLKLSGSSHNQFGPYNLVALYDPAPCPFTLSLSGGGGVLQVALEHGPPGAEYFTAASFHPANFDPATAGLGWAFGLHIALNDLATQHRFHTPPFRGTLDGSGQAGCTVAYLPYLAGLPIAAVSVVDGAGLVYDWTSVATFTF